MQQTYYYSPNTLIVRKLVRKLGKIRKKIVSLKGSSSPQCHYNTPSISEDLAMVAIDN